MPSILVYLLFFILGSAIGSFLTVIIDRFPKGEQFFSGRSRCDHCGHTLSFFDLFPLFSYIFLQGKCRYCKKSLSISYPLMESLAGILFVLVVLSSSTGLHDSQALFLPLLKLIIVSVLFVIFFIDLRFGYIPTWTIVALAALSLPIVFSIGMLNALLAAGSAFVLFLLLHLVTHGRGMGFGDVLLVIPMGLSLGFPTIAVALYIAFLTGSFVSIILILRRRKTLKSTVPFGPFLVLGYFVCLLWGPAVTDAFLRLLRFS